MNIYKLDAASNNSVDDIGHWSTGYLLRSPDENYKIYIIDGVHMLSASAFNAFLKTAEAPSYAVFILATTEKHKIIPPSFPAVRSSTSTISVDDIAGHLKASRKGVTAGEDALHVIAQEPAARCATLSMFDQLVSFAGNNLTYKAVIGTSTFLIAFLYFGSPVTCWPVIPHQVLLAFDEVLANGLTGTTSSSQTRRSLLTSWYVQGRTFDASLLESQSKRP